MHDQKRLGIKDNPENSTGFSRYIPAKQNPYRLIYERDVVQSDEFMRKGEEHYEESVFWQNIDRYDNPLCCGWQLKSGSYETIGGVVDRPRHRRPGGNRLYRRSGYHDHGRKESNLGNRCKTG